jgi:hypothetical protein
MPNHNTHKIVRNLRGTSGRRCSDGCASWIEHFRVHANLKAATCAFRGCTRTDLVGAHVLHTDGRTSNRWWIVPLCKGHNHYSNEEEMVLVKDLKHRLVPARV